MIQRKMCKDSKIDNLELILGVDLLQLQEYISPIATNIRYKLSIN